MNQLDYDWTGWQAKVITNIGELEIMFEVQSWCQNTFGEKWATTPPEWYKQSWYFSSAADATLFVLKWNQYVVEVDP